MEHVIISPGSTDAQLLSRRITRTGPIRLPPTIQSPIRSGNQSRRYSDHASLLRAVEEITY